MDKKFEKWDLKSVRCPRAFRTRQQFQEGNMVGLICSNIVSGPVYTEVETHLSVKLSKKNFGGILRPKSVRRTLVTGLICGLRANMQFDIVF